MCCPSRQEDGIDVIDPYVYRAPPAANDPATPASVSVAGSSATSGNGLNAACNGNYSAGTKHYLQSYMKVNFI